MNGTPSLSWSGVGLSAGLAAETVLRARIETHDLAMWRGADGVVRAWENRCPHRGMRLSYGFVRGERLNCRYHGWSYDGAGACVRVPANLSAAPPKRARATTYRCGEAAGIIWVAGPDGGGDALDLPGDDWIGCRTLAIAATAEQLASALGPSKSPIENTHLIEPAEIASVAAVLLAIQPVSPGLTLAHVSFRADGGASPALLRAVDAWARGIRAAAEDRIVTEATA